MPTFSLARTTLLALALASPTLPAVAARLELQGGHSYMDSYGANAAFAEAVLADRRIGDSRFRWAPDVSVGWIDGRDVARYRHKQPDTSDSIALVAAGARFYAGPAKTGSGRWFVSEQAAAIRGRTQALSSGYQFVSTLGWQGRHLSVQLRHISNGGLHQPNRGETMLLVGLGFGT